MKLQRRGVALGLGLSLLLLVGFAALWARSYWALDSWSRGDATGRTEVGLLSSRGRMMAWRVTAAPPGAPFARYAHKPQPGFNHFTRSPVGLHRYWLGPPQNDLNRAGFGQYTRDVYGARWQCLFLPWWALCVLAALPSLTWLRVRFPQWRATPETADTAADEAKSGA